MALCRCGASAIKPWCDGSHARTGFTGAKEPNRVSDHRDSYAGQQISILDNRGTCQHAGLCTDRLATVFHRGGEPFVTASGGRMDEIIRAVRDCPSGALSYAVDGVEARDEVDYHGTRDPAIEVTRDGPYRITGGIALVDEHGAVVARNEGASCEHYALCRCGHSQNKPFCSGMHYYVEFRDPVPDPGHEPTIFEWAGGLPAFLRMTRLFYEKHVPQDPLLAPLFATMAADHPQRVAKWLAEVFGGPRRYSTEHGGYRRGRRAFQTTPSSALRSRPTSNGAPGWPWRTPRPAPSPPSICPCRTGAGTPPPGHPAPASPPSPQLAKKTSPRPSCPPKGTGQLRSPHQAALPPTRPAVHAIRIRPVVL